MSSSAYTQAGSSWRSRQLARMLTLITQSVAAFLGIVGLSPGTIRDQVRAEIMECFVTNHMGIKDMYQYVNVLFCLVSTKYM